MYAKMLDKILNKLLRNMINFNYIIQKFKLFLISQFCNYEKILVVQVA